MSEIATIYDETLRSINYLHPLIRSMANAENMTGHLEHHAPMTDGSFAVCLAGGSGIFISEMLYSSILEQHRPAPDTSLASKVETLTGTMTSLETTFIPVIFTNAITGNRFRVVLCVIVLPMLYVGVYIGTHMGIVREQQFFRDQSLVFVLILGGGLV